MSVKIERIADSIQKELSYILQLEVRDSDIRFVTITDVHVTNDLSFAKVYFTVLREDKKEETLKGYVKEAEYDINYSSGSKIDYKKDLQARSLLKNYVLYRRFNRLAEFKQLYGGEYANLQARYYKPTNL